jgi:hypothetical protein
MNKLDLSYLNGLEKDGWLSKQTHPDFPLSIWCYTNKTVWEKNWTDITLITRGLILDGSGEIISRPFKKFFNWGELPLLNLEAPQTRPDILEKWDGSLGISYFYNNTWAIATKGSFNSNQALKATQLLYTKYSNVLPQLNPDWTYCWEIIYPENRIVLDYGDLEELVLINCLDTKTGEEIWPLPQIGFQTIKALDYSYDNLFNIAIPNKEGFVLRWESGFRAKVKFQEYIDLHRIITKITSYDIWEALQNDTLDKVIDIMPDEWYWWIKKIQTQLLESYSLKESEISKDWDNMNLDLSKTRKELASIISKSRYSKFHFLKLDKKDSHTNYKNLIWDLVKPQFEKPVLN